MMVDRTALTETMAQAIGQAIGGSGWWAVAKHDAREATRREAAAAIGALEASGYVVVPRQLSNDDVASLAGGDITVDTVRIVHQRMIAAADGR